VHRPIFAVRAAVRPHEIRPIPPCEKARKLMNQNVLQGNPADLDARAVFAARPPSPTWERVAPADCPQNAIWFWIKPPHVPHGLILRIPDEIYLSYPQLAAAWSMRKLLLTVGIDPACVAGWQLAGVAYDAMNGTSPFLDAAIPRPMPGMDPQIVVTVQPPLVMPIAMAPLVPQSAPQPVAATQSNTPSTPGSIGELYDRIETDWAATREIEKDLTRLRKSLVDMMARLKTLNRDLTPPERLYSTIQDKKDWTDARRWLRDSSSRCWRCIKDHDIGDTSSAGQRKWFEETYQQFVIPRRPHDNLQQAQWDFENYRKLVQTLHNAMSNALSMAAIDGERRAQTVLARIAAKVREATNRKNFLGVIVDG
jgi:hypothetical protein